MRRFSFVAILVLLAGFGPPSQARAGRSVAEPNATVTAKPGLARRSGNSRLTVPLSRRSVPPIRRPAPRVLSERQRASLPPPNWAYVYRPRTGEVRLVPPAQSPFQKFGMPLNSMPSDPGKLGKGPKRENIIGEDNRVRIQDTTEYPWRTVGKTFMWFPDGSQWSASGALITDFHILTAGHVVYNGDLGGWADYVEFVPGMDGDYEPFTSYWDVNLWSTSGWVDYQNPDYDWGLVTLDRPIGSLVGHFGYAHYPLEWYPGKTLNLAGYPGEFAQGLAQYWMADQATRATELVLYYLMDTTPGESGSPVWAYFGDTDQWIAVAAHAYGDNQENSGTRINETRFNNIWTWTNIEDPYPANLPDLADDGVQYSWFDPDTVQRGELFSAHCEIRNIGTTESLGFWVAFHASPDQTIEPTDPLIGAVFVPSTFPFEFYYEVDWSGPFPSTIPDGIYYVGWRIDSTDSVVEYDETNNTAFSPTALVVGTPPPPNINLMLPDFSPAGPIQVAPGDPILLSAFIQNNGGSTVHPFWLEFWGSRTGGFSNDLFLATSARRGPLAPGQSESFSVYEPLAGVPDGPYTVVLYADRPDEIVESNEHDNRMVVGGKRLLVIRPQTNADLAVDGFSFGPDPVYSGQPITLGGWVRNSGSQDSGPFWIEFWGSSNRLYPSLDFFLCDSIQVTNLGPDQSINLADYSRTLYATPSGTFMVGVLVDRPDQISELDETNNYLFVDGYRLNQAGPTAPRPEAEAAKSQLPDLVITSADFSPAGPFQAAPGTPLSLSVRIENQSSYWMTGPVWLEFWGSRTGGLTLDELIADSQLVPALGPWQGFPFSTTLPLYSIPDGPYTIVMVVDRPGQQAELNEGNNRFAVGRKRLLTIRPQTQANLLVEGFSLWPTTLHRGQTVSFGGRIRNAGTDPSGPFWIEFIGTFTPDRPSLNMFLCDSIRVPNLAPGAWFDLATQSRQLYGTLPTGSIGVVCFADRTDLVNESHEEDNYVILPGYAIAP